MTIESSTSLSTAQIVNLITCYNLVIMSGLLLIRRNNSLPNIILAFILLLPVVTYFGNAFLNASDLFRFPGFIYLNQVASILCAVFIDYYVKLFTGQKSRISVTLYVLAYMAIAVTLFYFVRYYFIPHADRSDLTRKVIVGDFPWHIKLIRTVFFVLMNAFFIHIVYRVWNYRRLALNFQSSTDKLKLQYIQSYVIIIWSLNLAIILAYCFVPNRYVDFIVVPLLTNAFYFYLLRMGFNHNVIFTEKDFTQYKAVVHEASETETRLNTRNELEPDKLEQIQKKIKYLLDEKLIYTEPELSIVKFSEFVGQPSHVVSQYINQFEKSNFFNLINSKRIELAKNKMKLRREGAEIEIIAFEVGFSSKSAFYRSFKKFTNQSPKEFIAQLE